ncbi:MAG: DNA-deoxyinosine glycosylase [Flavobacteriales bacterium]|nr:DNA-deoxyinosine glycosylase [Flavobacteriales bacterium]
MNRISSFPPLISEDSKVLILGSVPGIKSLEMQEYYAHPQNKFWRILFELFDEEFTTDYCGKIKLLKKYKIGVWDVIDSCERKGSLDTEIKNENHHNILKLLEDFPSIKVIFCNGQKSFKTLNKILPNDLEIPIVVLPSTSPAYTIPYDKKLQEWSVIKSYL